MHAAAFNAWSVSFGQREIDTSSTSVLITCLRLSFTDRGYYQPPMPMLGNGAFQPCYGSAPAPAPAPAQQMVQDRLPSYCPMTAELLQPNCTFEERHFFKKIQLRSWIEEREQTLYKQGKSFLNIKKMCPAVNLDKQSTNLQLSYTDIAELERRGRDLLATEAIAFVQHAVQREELENISDVSMFSNNSAVATGRVISYPLDIAGIEESKKDKLVLTKIRRFSNVRVMPYEKERRTWKEMKKGNTIIWPVEDVCPLASFQESITAEMKMRKKTQRNERLIANQMLEDPAFYLEGEETEGGGEEGEGAANFDEEEAQSMTSADDEEDRRLQVGNFIAFEIEVKGGKRTTTQLFAALVLETEPDVFVKFLKGHGITNSIKSWPKVDDTSVVDKQSIHYLDDISSANHCFY
ncbi:hypothetical protein KP79_PYT01339 [Mizuhopecten yessoensis]|uniref:Uncharacterized protein n=1 Tax=Mizuhopecten yessoensis TaxID=6573 RepID=A0A210QET5_MIZYE|nr:hypothetical protein KP79_PYT01339 [Mizuhopecten yessoensis]